MPILFGHLEKKDFKKMADIIKKYVTPKTLIIASSDFTHYGASYGYVPLPGSYQREFDQIGYGND